MNWGVILVLIGVTGVLYGAFFMREGCAGGILWSVSGAFILTGFVFLEEIGWVYKLASFYVFVVCAGFISAWRQYPQASKGEKIMFVIGTVLITAVVISIFWMEAILWEERKQGKLSETDLKKEKTQTEEILEELGY